MKEANNGPPADEDCSCLPFFGISIITATNTHSCTCPLADGVGVQSTESEYLTRD